MRTLLKHLAWGLATAALAIATPLRAAAYTGTPPTATLAATAQTTASASHLAQPVSATELRSTIANAFESSATAQTETGRGWRDAYCLACVGLGTLALYAGGITMLPVILANPAAFGTFAGTCIYACESLLEHLGG